MRVAVIGSRNLIISNLENYLPLDTTEIVSGGAVGIDACANDYAKKNGLKMTIFYPDYKQYGKSAPLKRNLKIIEYADIVYAFWDGKSHGTKFVIENCRNLKKPIKVYVKKDKI